LKFKRLVTAKPLVPDRDSLDRIGQLKREQKRKNAQLLDAVADYEQTIKELESSKLGEEDKEELVKIDKETEEVRQRFT
jgi:hypothetical protein